ncbi:DUF4826 family protein [Alteromonas sp. BL110]|uniref:DUF4826 family protein n=1 Tax=Alteromonas sp. BL110 TaxID=1714845 RepID=UPI000E4EAC7A|nr:DUF4826 family protein [Alteromonas sp. BL110]AXT40531.1 DUF4826 family protein [Alteromonas sp. BL110]RKM79765.1 DUF4826 family protein [Alteromonas sp. BL110]
MAEQQERQPISEEEHANWVREQFQKANKFLAENGVLFDTVITEDSRYLMPYLAVWKIKAMDGKLYWVISGDLPSDYTSIDNAKNAKEVLRHFSMHWQLKAENLINAKGADESQKAFGELLVNRAESLFAMQNTPELWV